MTDQYDMGTKECKCPVCGKTYFRSARWAYKIDAVYFCSWTCLRKKERELDGMKSRRRRVGKNKD